MFAVELHLHPRWFWLSRRNPKLQVPRRAMAATTLFPSWRHHLGELAFSGGCVFLLSTWWWISGQRLQAEVLWVEAASSETMLSKCFMGQRSCLHVLGGNLVSIVRRGCRLGLRVLGEAVWLLGQGGSPGSWCSGHDLRAVFPMQLGLWVAGSGRIVARLWAEVRRGGRPGR
jgi:hypothetical protein